MTKLDELGGLESIRSQILESHEFGHRTVGQSWFCNECNIEALIERIEELEQLLHSPSQIVCPKCGKPMRERDGNGMFCDSCQELWIGDSYIPFQPSTLKTVIESYKAKLQRYRELAERIVKYLPDVQQHLHRLGYETVAVEVSIHIAEASKLLKED